MITKRLMNLAVVATVLISACGKKTPAYTKYIPSDATLVMSIDTKSILTKLNSDSLSVEKIMAVMKDSNHQDDYTKALSKFNEFKDAGIDWDSKVYIAASSLNMMAYNNFSIQLVAGMKDVQKLEDFLKKQSQTKEIKKGEGYSFTGDEDFAIGWNSDVVMFIAGGNRSRYDVYLPDNTTANKPKSETNANSPAEKLKKYFKLEKKESIASVDGFNDLQGKPADITIFNQANLNDISGVGIGLAFLPKLKELIEGTYSSTTINFDNGKAVITSNVFVGKKLADILKKYAGPEVDLSLIENYPSQNVNGVMLFSFKPELIPALIKESGLDALLNLGLIQTGMSLDEFGKIFKGDFAIAVSDFAVNPKEINRDGMTYKTETPTAKLIFTAKIGDKAIFNKLIGFIEKQGRIIRNGNMLIQAYNGRPLENTTDVFSIANDMFTYATDSSLLTAYQNKTQKIGLADDVKNKLKGNAIAAFFDVDKTLSGISPNLFDSTDIMAADVLSKAKNTFKTGMFTSSNFNGKSVESKGEIVFTDSKKNSLAQLVRYMMYAAEMGKKAYAIARKQNQVEDVIRMEIADSIAATKHRSK